jgi:hypothetical protein
MKMIKTCITNPELVKVGQPCEVKVDTQWMGMNTKEPYIYLPAKIKMVNYKDGEDIPCVLVTIRKCVKRGNYYAVDNVMILPSEIGEKIYDHFNEYHFKDYQTIIFK